MSTLLDDIIYKNKKKPDCEFFVPLTKHPLEKHWVEKMNVIGYCKYKNYYIGENICFKAEGCAKKEN